jgi:oligopeptidase B
MSIQERTPVSTRRVTTKAGVVSELPIGQAYPTILVESSLNDSQVMYREPSKYVAKFRANRTDSNPLVFQVNLEPSGHSGKSGRYDALHDVAFEYAFMLLEFGVKQ